MKVLTYTTFMVAILPIHKQQYNSGLFIITLEYVYLQRKIMSLKSKTPMLLNDLYI